MTKDSIKLSEIVSMWGTNDERIGVELEGGWYVSSDNGYTNSNIVEESQFSEWTELFNKLSVQERENILKEKL